MTHKNTSLSQLQIEKYMGRLPYFKLQPLLTNEDIFLSYSCLKNVTFWVFFLNSVAEFYMNSQKVLCMFEDFLTYL